MSDSDIVIDLSGIDGLTPEIDRLVSELAAITPITSRFDPIVTAAETAVCAVGGVCGSAPIVAATLRLMPSMATPFERGLALGMALVLAARPRPA